VLNELEDLRPSEASFILSENLRAVERIVENARRQSRHLGRHAVYFLSDLGRIGWSAGQSQSAKTEVRRLGSQLAGLADLTVVDLGQDAAENVAAADLRSLEAAPTTGQDIGFAVTLKNFSRQPKSRQAVELLVDGCRADQQEVDLPPNGEATANFTYRFESAGRHAVEARAPGDALDLDNHRYLAIEVEQSLKVLCIDGHPSAESFQGAADYLATVLSMDEVKNDYPRVEVEVAAESAIVDRDLNRYACVFLCEAPQFSAGEARVLHNYLRRGGSLVFFLGEGVSADRYNRVFWDNADAPKVLPVRLGAVIGEPQYSLDARSFDHPLVQTFRGRGRAALLNMPVWKHFKLELPEQSKARVALWLGSGDPLVVEEAIGRGRSVVVGTTADRAWTPMPIWPSFAPLMWELLAYCAGRENQLRNVAVGESLGGVVSPESAGAPVELSMPDGQSRAPQTRADGDAVAWSFDETSSSGIYSVKTGPAGGQLFSVNLNTIESDLTKLGPDDLRGDVWPDVAFAYQTTWESQPPLAMLGGHASILPVGLLYTVCGLLFVETFIAWRFGYKAR
jgi:hypothetical protein